MGAPTGARASRLASCRRLNPAAGSSACWRCSPWCGRGQPWWPSWWWWTRALRRACVACGQVRSVSVSGATAPGAVQSVSLAGWSRARPALPCNGFAHLLPLAAPPHAASRAGTPETAIPREPRSLAAAALRSRFGPRVQVGRPSPEDRHRDRMGGFEEQSGDTTMAQIGTFTRSDDGSFSGTIRTLNINTKATIKARRQGGRARPRLPGRRQRGRARRGLEQGGQGQRRRVRLGQARRPLLHRPGLRTPWSRAKAASTGLIWSR